MASGGGDRPQGQPAEGFLLSAGSSLCIKKRDQRAVRLGSQGHHSSWQSKLPVIESDSLGGFGRLTYEATIE